MAFDDAGGLLFFILTVGFFCGAGALVISDVNTRPSDAIVRRIDDNCILFFLIRKKYLK